jgi:enoyl-CoA hydratase/carnithine racemase
MSADLVVQRNVGQVHVVSMNRPGQKNAMDTGLLSGLVSALQEVSESEASSVVITGEGGVFSAGADVTEMVDKEGADERMDLFTALYDLVTSFPKPIVAAIAGPCIGAGAEVASGCDLRVGTASARIRFPGAQFGIPVGAARLPLLIGLSHAKDLLLTSRTVSGDEAYRIGFLNRLVSEESLEEEAAALAAGVAERPGAVIQKRQLDLMLEVSARTASENRALRRWQADSQTLMGD